MKKDIKNIIRTFEAVGPLVGNALKSGQLLNPQAELRYENEWPIARTQYH